MVVKNHRDSYNPYETSRPLSADTEAMLNNAEALDAKYGMTAADRCAAGADDYIRSIARFRFHWDDNGMLENRFDGFEHSVVSPGVLTLTTNKARLSNGFGVFNPSKSTATTTPRAEKCSTTPRDPSRNSQRLANPA